MNSKVRRGFDPRKTPVQARAAVTVDAISEATVQVLLSHGADRLTTTRVAERAGVSVGTLYQYYPNKESLLFALLEQHMGRVGTAVETACEAARGKPLADMMESVIASFVAAKMERPDVSTALYRISTDVGGPELVKRAEERSRKALQAMLETAADAETRPEPFAVVMMYSAMSGATRTVLEAGASPAMVRDLRIHLTLLCRSYLTSVAHRGTRSKSAPR